ncbi:hypothetical protein BaRGS_00019642 [Batillaria attramentaria]|uniref:Uncharacterized protein n=1 Tax=Batillaria attramentaria TaxID=370345 RepID=A0ABD0KPE8_9CAEN
MRCQERGVGGGAMIDVSIDPCHPAAQFRVVQSVRSWLRKKFLCLAIGRKSLAVRPDQRPMHRTLSVIFRTTSGFDLESRNRIRPSISTED